MAILKNTADLLAEAAANLPDNSTQEISPQDVREMVENIAFSSYNKITDAPLVGLQEFSTSLNYNTGKAIIRNGDIYVANTDVTAGAFDALEWDLVTLPSKQNALISGTNIKTINGVSVLGSGNLTVQETLVSGTNIKTINGVSVLGSGDLTVSDTTLFDGGKTLGGNVTNDLNGNIFALNNGSVILNGASKIGSEDISLQGETYIQRASTSSADTVLSLLDNVNTELWDWRANGDVYLGQSTSIFDSSSNEVLKLGELFTGSATNGVLNFQSDVNEYPINIYSGTATNSGGYRMRIGLVSNVATILGNASLDLSAGNNATLSLANSARRMIFSSNSRNVLLVDENSDSHISPASGRGFGVGLTGPQSKLHVQGDGTEPIFIAETSGGSNTFQVLEDGSFAIADGITAPSSDTGIAKIYIDSADGDLKVIFSDGTVKTIVTDT